MKNNSYLIIFTLLIIGLTGAGMRTPSVSILAGMGWKRMFLCGNCNCRYTSKMAAEACCNGKGGVRPVMSSVNFLEFTKEKKHKCDVEESTVNGGGSEEEIGD